MAIVPAVQRHVYDPASSEQQQELSFEFRKMLFFYNPAADKFDRLQYPGNNPRTRPAGIAHMHAATVMLAVQHRYCPL